MSFWQGVDVPGPTLSLVTIDRLPFPRPDDPLLEARRERAGAGAFRPSTSPGPPPCWPRGRAGSSGRRPTPGWWPCSTPVWPRPATAGP
jgi:hypothetical protein